MHAFMYQLFEKLVSRKIWPSENVVVKFGVGKSVLENSVSENLLSEWCQNLDEASSSLKCNQKEAFAVDIIS